MPNAANGRPGASPMVFGAQPLPDPDRVEDDDLGADGDHLLDEHRRGVRLLGGGFDQDGQDLGDGVDAQGHVYGEVGSLTRSFS